MNGYGERNWQGPALDRLIDDLNAKETDRQTCESIARINEIADHERAVRKVYAIGGMIVGAACMFLVDHARADDIIVSGGTGTGAAVRVAMNVDTKWDWLKAEVGVLGTQGGAIVDVTPMLHYGKSWYVEGGIGIGDNFINNPDQAKGLIFHDTVRFGYKQVFVEATHYSNGGSYNPLFGTDNNAGFSYLLVGAKFKF